MGYNTYTTDDLCRNILLISHMPTGNNTFTNANLITLADRELQTAILKQILSTRGGYYLSYQDYPLASDGLYNIPSECVAGALENIELIESTVIIPVNEIEESEQVSTISPTSSSYGYFIKGNDVQILPTPNIGFPRLWFAKRPSKLIPTNQASQITSINGDVLTVTSLPSILSVGKYVDLLGDQPPFNLLNENFQIIGIASTDVTLDQTPNASLAVGDWIALHAQTPIPQIPVEFRILLEQRVVCKIYELQNYLDKLAAAKKSLEELEQATFSLITPRVKAKTKVINPIQGGFLSGTNRLSRYPAAP